jgi:catechol 2,3-dioxygenase
MRIGHAHIKVRELEASKNFYQNALGLRVTEELAGRYAFMTGTSMHHEIALQAVGKQARIPQRFDTGLFHVAFEVHDKSNLANAYQRLVELDIPVVCVDHRISWAIYFSDPDGNGLEIYCDTRKKRGIETWDGRDEELTPDILLSEL